MGVWKRNELTFAAPAGFDASVDAYSKALAHSGKTFEIHMYEAELASGAP